MDTIESNAARTTILERRTETLGKRLHRSLTLAFECKLRLDANKEDAEDVEERLRKLERTDIKARLIGGLIYLAVAAAAGLAGETIGRHF